MWALQTSQFSLVTIILVGRVLTTTFGQSLENEPSEIRERRGDDAYVIMKYGVTPIKVEQTDFTPEESRPCQCGVSSRLSARVVGGKPTAIEEYPWMVGLVVFNNLFCGGALINDKYILTAAHCFKIKSILKHVRARLGSTQRMDNRNDFDVEEIVIHKNYDSSRSGYYDIGLVKLLKPAMFSNHIRPICLPTQEPGDFVGQVGTVAGWGLIKHEGAVSDTLRRLDMTIADFEKCLDLYLKLGRQVDADVNFCAGGIRNEDACQGDSGGPMFQVRDGVYRQIGIISWGIGCALENIPGIYTNVFALLPWIEYHIKVPLCTPAE